MMLKINRAMDILAHIRTHSARLGAWIDQQKGDDIVAIWNVEKIDEWSARFEFSGSISPSRDDGTEMLVANSHSFTLDLWVEPTGIKSLSLYWSAQARRCQLISMRPGPWETMFGLPNRAWNASDAQRLKLPPVAA